MTTILITGSRGAFAKALLSRLLDHSGVKVIGVVRNNAINAHEIECDLSNKDSVIELIRSIRPSIIYHLAASFTSNFESDVMVNAYCAQWMFEELLRSDIKCRVIIFGSAAEYGAVKITENPIPETHCIKPISVYGLTKALQSQISYYYASQYEVDIVIARVFNLAIDGLNTRLFYGKITNYINSYKHGEIKKLYLGNLSSVRDYIGLDQAIQQIFSISHYGIMGETYNVGSGIPTKMEDLLLSILEQNNIPYNCYEVTTTNFTKNVDVPVIYADISKVTNLV